MKRFNWLFCVLVMTLNMVACEKAEVPVEEQEMDIVEVDNGEIQFECAIIEECVRKELGLAEGTKIDGEKLEQIETLNIRFVEDCEALNLAGDLQHFTNLKVLQVYVDPELSKEIILDYDVWGIHGELQTLEELYIRDFYLDNISFVSNFKELKRLYIPETSVSDISILREMTQLTHLSLYGTQVRDITPLTKLTELKELSLAYCDEIENIECIASMTKMENLGLMGCGIKDISFLRDMKKLHSINLSENKIEDITLLAEFSNLSGVVLDDNKITDVSALVGLENLVFVSLYDNPIQNAGLLVGVDPCFDVTVGRGAKMEAWNAEVEKALQVYDVTVEVDGHLQEVEDYYVGDATGDGIADIGIVTSWQNEEADGVRLDRWLYVYPGTGLSYKNPMEPIALSDGTMGGMQGDPYKGIILQDGKLIVQEQGGSLFSWEVTNVYKAQNGKWDCVIETMLDWYGYSSGYDYTIEDYEKNLRFSYTLCEDQDYQWYKLKTGEYQIGEENTDKLPDTTDSYNHYQYHHEMEELPYSAQDALEMIVTEYYGEYEKKKVYITQKEEHESCERLLGFEIPDYYYVLDTPVGPAEIYYYGKHVNEQEEEQHKVMVAINGAAYKLYMVDVQTGEMSIGNSYAKEDTLAYMQYDWVNDENIWKYTTMDMKCPMYFADLNQDGQKEVMIAVEQYRGDDLLLVYTVYRGEVICCGNMYAGSAYADIQDNSLMEYSPSALIDVYCDCNGEYLYLGCEGNHSASDKEYQIYVSEFDGETISSKLVLSADFTKEEETYWTKVNQQMDELLYGYEKVDIPITESEYRIPGCVNLLSEDEQEIVRSEIRSALTYMIQ